MCKNRHDITEIFQTDPVSKIWLNTQPYMQKIKKIIIKKRANTTFRRLKRGKRETEKSSRNPPFLKARGGSERSPRHCIQAKDKTRKDWNRKREKKQVSKREVSQGYQALSADGEENPAGTEWKKQNNSKNRWKKEPGCVSGQAFHNESPPGLWCADYIALFEYFTLISPILAFA